MIPLGLAIGLFVGSKKVDDEKDSKKEKKKKEEKGNKMKEIKFIANSKEGNFPRNIFITGSNF